VSSIDKLTDAQQAALVRWHKAFGRNWRSALMERWRKGHGHSSLYAPELQQIRNQFLQPAFINSIATVDLVAMGREQP
jgi:hypothetical protein